MISRMEALAEAIAHYTGYQNPESSLYVGRNPLGLKAFNQKHEKDADNRRVFRSLMQGWQSGLFDLSVKCNGKSADKRLKPTATLLDLMLSYGWQETMADYVAKWLKRALKDNSVSRHTTLAYFLEKD